MTALLDNDRYYTPPSIATRALECAQLNGNPMVCVDTACGLGSLLSAAEDVLQAKFCVGIDNDTQVIRQLRRERPNWRLYVGDLLKRHRAPPTNFLGENHDVDLLVLNPPFSLGSKKYVSIKYLGQNIKCSVAMAHILRSMELFKPTQGAIAVVPESLLYSDTDQHAREILNQQFSLSELLQLSIYTFKGARVNSSFVQLTTPNVRPIVHVSSSKSVDPIPATIVRGGLQMHRFQRTRSGARVIHSTTLRQLAIDGISTATERSTVSAKGRISGWMLLLPRVGIPHKEAFRAIYSREELQLSDCVIGIRVPTKMAASCAERRIHGDWSSLVSLYRGTGARYITIDRLIDWLYEKGIHDCGAMQETLNI